MEEILLYFSLKYNGNFEEIYKALEKREKVDENLKERLLKQVTTKYTTVVSDDYPEGLKHISCPPFVLYYYGNISYVQDNCIGVIGMRIPSEYGKSTTNKMVCDLVKKNYTIVSGMALGVDAIAHRSALKNQGRTIAILGSGINYCYPKSNHDIYETMKQEHLIMSEYPNDLVPLKENFPRRNRIIAGISNAILVTEAKQRSGTMITVGHALEQGKDVFCIPSRVTDYLGCNYLIQQGAKLINNVEDIIEEII